MASDRRSLQALKNLISEADLILEITPPLPQNRTTAAAREALRAALVLTDDLIAQFKLSPAVVLGHKGRGSTARKLGSEHYRQMAAERKSAVAAGRASKPNKICNKVTPPLDSSLPFLYYRGEGVE
jgi:hypothetical protein